MKLSISVAVMALYLSPKVDAAKFRYEGDLRLLIHPRASSESKDGVSAAPFQDFPNYNARSPGTCYQSDENEDNHIWQAEFEKGVTNVTSVSILARKDCCDNRIDGVRVYVDDIECGQIQSIGKGKWVDVQCKGGLVGKYITLKSTAAEGQDKSDAVLNFCGIKVEGS